MARFLIAFISLFLFGLFVVQQIYAETCSDDPRLPQTLRELAGGGAEIASPLAVSPETWLEMAPEFRELLAGKAKIYPAIPVLKNGKPLKKPELDFPLMWTAIRNAAMHGDRDRGKWIFDTFRAKPMPVAEILKTLEKTGMTDKGQELLCEVAGVANTNRTLIIDFFNAFGGAPSDKTRVLTGIGFKADIYSLYPCEKYRDWVTLEELKAGVGTSYPLNALFERLDALGLDTK